MKTVVTIILGALLVGGCGEEQPRAEEPPPPTLDELRERYRKEAESEINADNAARKVEELRREIEADEER